MPKPQEYAWRPAAAGFGLMDRKDRAAAYAWKGSDGGYWWQFASGDPALHGPFEAEFEARKAAENALHIRTQAADAKRQAEKEAKKAAFAKGVPA